MAERRKSAKAARHSVHKQHMLTEREREGHTTVQAHLGIREWFSFHGARHHTHHSSMG